MTTPSISPPSAPHSHTTACWWHPLEARWVCEPNSDGAPLVDVRDMLVVHTALLREFRLASAAVRRVSKCDRRHARRVAEHLRFVGDMLHHHHEGEDQLLWPLLVERAPILARALADGEAQHATLDHALDDVARLRDAWARDADADTRDALARRLDVLSKLLCEHLDLEERELLPAAAATLRSEEWAAIGARAAASMSKPALALAFGMFAYEGDPVVLSRMLSDAPPPVRAVLLRLAPRLFARRARRVHGTARP